MQAQQAEHIGLYICQLWIKLIYFLRDLFPPLLLMVLGFNAEILMQQFDQGQAIR